MNGNKKYGENVHHEMLVGSAFTLPHPTLTIIPNNNPPAVPSLWNTTYAEIQDNFNALTGFVIGINVAGDGTFITTDNNGKLTIVDNSIIYPKLKTHLAINETESQVPAGNWVSGENLLVDHTQAETIKQAIARLGALDPASLNKRLDQVTQKLLDIIAELDLMRENPYDSNGPFWVIILDYIGKYGFTNGVLQFVSDHDLQNTSIGWRLKQFVDDKSKVGIEPQRNRYIGESFHELSATSFGLQEADVEKGNIQYYNGFIYVLKDKKYLLRIDPVSGEVVNTYGFGTDFTNVASDQANPFVSFTIDVINKMIYLVTSGQIDAPLASPQKIISFKIDFLPNQKNVLLTDQNIIGKVVSAPIAFESAQTTFNASYVSSGPWIWHCIGITSDQYGNTYLLLDAQQSIVDPPVGNVSNIQHIRQISSLNLLTSGLTVGLKNHIINWFVNLGDTTISQDLMLLNKVNYIQTIQKSATSTISDLEFFFYKKNNNYLSNGDWAVYRVAPDFNTSGANVSLELYGVHDFIPRYYVQDTFFPYFDSSFIGSHRDLMDEIPEQNEKRAFGLIKLAFLGYGTSFSRYDDFNTIAFGFNNRKYTTANPFFFHYAGGTGGPGSFENNLNFREPFLSSLRYNYSKIVASTNIFGDTGNLLSLYGNDLPITFKVQSTQGPSSFYIAQVGITTEFYVDVKLIPITGDDAASDDYKALNFSKDCLQGMFIKIGIGCQPEFYKISRNDHPDVNNFSRIYFTSDKTDLLTRTDINSIGNIGAIKYTEDSETITKGGRLLYKNFSDSATFLTSAPWEMLSPKNKLIPTTSFSSGTIIQNELVPSKAIRTNGVYLYGSKYGFINQIFDETNAPNYNEALKTYYKYNGGNLNSTPDWDVTYLSRIQNKLQRIAEFGYDEIFVSFVDPANLDNIAEYGTLNPAAVVATPWKLVICANGTGVFTANQLVGDVIQITNNHPFAAHRNTTLTISANNDGTIGTTNGSPVSAPTGGAGLVQGLRIYIDMVYPGTSATYPTLKDYIRSFTPDTNFDEKYRFNNFEQDNPWFDFSLFPFWRIGAQITAQLLDNTNTVVATTGGPITKDIVNNSTNELFLPFTGGYFTLDANKKYVIKITNSESSKSVFLPANKFNSVFTGTGNTLSNITKLHFTLTDNSNSIKPLIADNQDVKIGQLLEDDDRIYYTFDTLDGDNTLSYSAVVGGRNYSTMLSSASDFTSRKAFQSKEMWGLYARIGTGPYHYALIKVIDPDYEHQSIYDPISHLIIPETETLSGGALTIALGQNLLEAENYFVGNYVLTQAQWDFYFGSGNPNPPTVVSFIKKKLRYPETHPTWPGKVIHKKHYALSKVLNIVDERIYMISMNFSAPTIYPRRDRAFPTKWTSGYKYFNMHAFRAFYWDVDKDSVSHYEVSGNGWSEKPQPSLFWFPGDYDPTNPIGPSSDPQSTENNRKDFNYYWSDDNFPGFQNKVFQTLGKDIGPWQGLNIFNFLKDPLNTNITELLYRDDNYTQGFGGHPVGTLAQMNTDLQSFEASELLGKGLQQHIQHGFDHYGAVIYVYDKNTFNLVDKWSDEAYNKHINLFSDIEPVLNLGFNFVFPFFKNIELRNGIMNYNHGYLNLTWPREIKEIYKVVTDFSFFKQTLLPSSHIINYKEPFVVDGTAPGVQTAIVANPFALPALTSYQYDYAIVAGSYQISGGGNSIILYSKKFPLLQIKLDGISVPNFTSIIGLEYYLNLFEMDQERIQERFSHYRKIFDCIDIQKIHNREFGTDKDIIGYGIVSYNERIEFNESGIEQIRPEIEASVWDLASYTKLSHKIIKQYEQNDKFLNDLPALTFPTAEPYLFMPISCKLCDNGSLLFMVINANPGGSGEIQVVDSGSSFINGLNSSNTAGQLAGGNHTLGAFIQQPVVEGLILPETINASLGEDLTFAVKIVSDFYNTPPGNSFIPPGSVNTFMPIGTYMEFLKANPANTNVADYKIIYNKTNVAGSPIPALDIFGVPVPGTGTIVLSQGSVPSTAGLSTISALDQKYINFIVYYQAANSGQYPVAGPNIPTVVAGSWYGLQIESAGSYNSIHYIMAGFRRYILTGGSNLPDYPPIINDFNFPVFTNDPTPGITNLIPSFIDTTNPNFPVNVADTGGSGFETDPIYWTLLSAAGPNDSNEDNVQGSNYSYQGYKLDDRSSFTANLFKANPILPHIFRLDFATNELIDITNRMDKSIKEKFWGRKQQFYSSYLKTFSYRVVKNVNNANIADWLESAFIFKWNNHKDLNGSANTALDNWYFQVNLRKKDQPKVYRESFTPTFFMNFPYQFGFSNCKTIYNEQGNVEDVKVSFWSTFRGDSNRLDNSIFEYSLTKNDVEEIILDDEYLLQESLDGERFEYTPKFKAKFDAKYIDNRLGYIIKKPIVDSQTLLNEEYANIFYLFSFIRDAVRRFRIPTTSNPQVVTFLSNEADIDQWFQLYFSNQREAAETLFQQKPTSTQTFGNFILFWENVFEGGGSTSATEAQLFSIVLLFKQFTQMLIRGQYNLAQILGKLSIGTSNAYYSIDPEIKAQNRLYGAGDNALQKETNYNKDQIVKMISGYSLAQSAMKWRKDVYDRKLSQDDVYGNKLLDIIRAVKANNKTGTPNPFKFDSSPGGTNDPTIVNAFNSSLTQAYLVAGFYFPNFEPWSFDVNYFELIKDEGDDHQKYANSRHINQSSWELGTKDNLDFGLESSSISSINRNTLVFAGSDFAKVNGKIANETTESIRIWHHDNRHVSRALKSSYTTNVNRDPNKILKISVATPHVVMPREEVELAEDTVFSSYSIFVSKGRLGNLITKGDLLTIEDSQVGPGYGTREFVLVDSVEDNLNGKPCEVKVNLLQAILDENQFQTAAISNSETDITIRFTEEGLANRLPATGVITIPLWQTHPVGLTTAITLDVNGHPIPRLDIFNNPMFEIIIYRNVVVNGNLKVTLVGCQRGVNGSTADGHFNGDPIYFGINHDHAKGDKIRFQVNKSMLPKMMKLWVYVGNAANDPLKEQFLLAYNTGNQVTTTANGLQFNASDFQWEEIDLTNFAIQNIDRFYVKSEIQPTDYKQDGVLVERINMFWTNPLT